MIRADSIGARTSQDVQTDARRCLRHSPHNCFMCCRAIDRATVNQRSMGSARYKTLPISRIRAYGVSPRGNRPKRRRQPSWMSSVNETIIPVRITIAPSRDRGSRAELSEPRDNPIDRSERFLREAERAILFSLGQIESPGESQGRRGIMTRRCFLRKRLIDNRSRNYISASETRGTFESLGTARVRACASNTPLLEASRTRRGDAIR